MSFSSLFSNLVQGYVPRLGATTLGGAVAGAVCMVGLVLFEAIVRWEFWCLIGIIPPVIVISVIVLCLIAIPGAALGAFWAGLLGSLAALAPFSRGSRVGYCVLAIPIGAICACITVATWAALLGDYLVLPVPWWLTTLVLLVVAVAIPMTIENDKRIPKS